jgi:hypothetical protein
MRAKKLRPILVAVLVVAVAGVISWQAPASAADSHTVSGIVLGDGQQPLAGATVRFRNGNLEDFTTTTGSDGRYALSVPDDEYGAKFDAPGYASGWYGEGASGVNLRVSRADLKNVSVHLHRAGSIRGSVVAGGKPAEGIFMRLEPIAGGKSGEGEHTAADGTYAFPDVVPGTYVLQADGHDEAFEDATVSPIVVKSGQAVVVPRMTMAAASALGRLKGVITADRATSTTIPAYPEWAITTTDAPMGRGYSDFITRPAQPVEANRLQPGSYKIALDENTWIGGASFLTAKTFAVQAGRTTTFSGSARHGVGFEVLVQNARQEHLRDMQVIFRRTADPTEIIGQAKSPSWRGTGYVDIDGLPAAAYSMTVIDPTGEYASKTVKNAPRNSVVTLTRRVSLPPVNHRAGKATVTIDSAYINPTDVQFFRADDDELSVSTTHNDDPETGQWTWAIEPGAYRIRLAPHAWYGGGTFAKATVVDLTDGKLTRLPYAGLDPWGSYVGWVRDDAGLSVDGMWVRAYAADDPTEVVAVENVDSQFILDPLPVRAYKFRLTDPSGRYATTWVGGGSSFATAKSYTPDFFEKGWLGTTTVVRNFRAVSSPTITGTLAVGHKLQSRNPLFSRPGAAITRRWYRDGSPISGAVNTTYRLTRSDAGHRITIRVTGRKTGYGTVSATSVPTGTVKR